MQVTVTWAHNRGVLLKMRFLAWTSLAIFGLALASAVVQRVKTSGPAIGTVDLLWPLLGAEVALTLLWLLVDSFRQDLR